MIRNRLVNAGWNPQRAEKIHKAAEGLSPRQQIAVVNKALAPRSAKYTSKALLTPDEQLIAHIEKRKNSNTASLISKSLPYREREWDEEKHKRDSNGRFATQESHNMSDPRYTGFVSGFDSAFQQPFTQVFSNMEMTQPEMKQVETTQPNFNAVQFMEAIFTQPEFKLIAMKLAEGKQETYEKLESMFESKAEMHKAKHKVRDAVVAEEVQQANAAVKEEQQVIEAETVEGRSEVLEETDTREWFQEKLYMTPNGKEAYINDEILERISEGAFSNVRTLYQAVNQSDPADHSEYFDSPGEAQQAAYEQNEFFGVEEGEEGSYTNEAVYFIGLDNDIHMSTEQLMDFVEHLTDSISSYDETRPQERFLVSYQHPNGEIYDQPLTAAEIFEHLDPEDRADLAELALQAVPVVVTREVGTKLPKTWMNQEIEELRETVIEDPNAFWYRYGDKKTGDSFAIHFDLEKGSREGTHRLSSSYVRKGHYNPTPDSSFVKGTYYSKRKRRLTVKLDSGKQYDFEGISHARAWEFKKTPSQGQAFNTLRRENAARSK